MIDDLTIEEILPYSVLFAPLIWVNPIDKAWIVTSVLSRYLGSFTDCITVIDNGQIVGAIDGRDILGKIFKNPTYDFFQNSTAADFMVKEELTITSKTKLSELIKNWNQTRRAYSILKNNDDNFIAISAKSISDGLVPMCNTLKDSDIQKSEIITCSKDDTVGEVLELMFNKKIRRIFYEDHGHYISDRTILKKIVRDLAFLYDVDEFLDMKVSQFDVLSPTVVKNGMSFSEIISKMAHHEHPCLLFPNNAIMTYYDIVISVGKFLK
jgi:predicted transcriptional regulator